MTYTVVANDHYLTLPDQQGDPFGDRDFSIETWAKVTQPSASAALVRGGTESHGGHSFRLYVHPDGAIKFLTTNGSTLRWIVSKATPASNGHWHHIAVVRRGSALSVYLDGVLVPGKSYGPAQQRAAKPTKDSTPAAAATQQIEGRASAQGPLATLALWNVSRSEQQIYQDMHTDLQGNESGLAGWWNFTGTTTPSLQSTQVLATPPAPTTTGAVLLSQATYSPPTITGVNFDGASTLVQWDPVSGAGQYKVGIFKGGAPVYNGYTSATQARLTVALQLDQSYIVQVCAVGSQGVGPWSDPIPLVLNAPQNFTVSAVFGGLQANWGPPSQSVVGYRVGVLDGNTQVAHVDATSTTAFVQVPNDPTKAFAAQVCGTAGPNGISTGPWSNAVTVCAAPVLQSVSFDGTTIDVRWDAITAPGVTGYTAVVYQDQTRVYNGSGSATSASITIGLQPSKPYVLAVKANGAGLVGALSAAVPLVLDVPQGLALTVAGNEIQATWASTSDASSYRLRLLDGTTEVSHTDTTGASGSLPIPVDQTKTYTMEVCGLAGSGNISSGPWSPTVTVILAQPVLTTVDYDGTTITATWGAVTASGVSGYWVGVFQGDTQVYNGMTSSTQAQITLGLQADKSYTVQVRAKGAASQGPWGAAVWIITAVPTVELVAYEGQATAVSFQLPSGSGVTGVAGQVLVDGQATYTGDGSQSPLTIPGTLQASHANTVQVRCTGDKTTGPWSLRATILLANISALLAATDGTQVTARWQSVQGVEGYEAALASNGTWGDPQSTTAANVAFTGQLQPGVQYQVRVRTCTGSSRGPWSQPVPGPYLRTGTLTYDGLGRMQTVHFATTTTTTHDFDALGNITAVSVAPSQAQQT